MLERMWEKGSPPILLVGMLIGTTTRANSMEVPWKMKNIITKLSCDPTLGLISRKEKNSNSKIYMHSNVSRSTIYNSQHIGTEICPSTKEWIKKILCVYIHNGILLSHKKEWNNAICSNISKCLVTQSCLTLCDPMDCSPPDCSARGISQARILE